MTSAPTENADRPMVIATGKQVLALCGTIVVVLGTGLFLLTEKLYDQLESSVSDLQKDTAARFSGTADEDRDLRSFVQRTNETLRGEFAANRQDLAQQISKLGDRIVESNREVSGQLGQLRTELISVMEKGDSFINDRFDDLEQKVDTLLGRISFEPSIELDAGTTYMIDSKGILRDQESGEPIGMLPAIVAPAKPKP